MRRTFNNGKPFTLHPVAEESPSEESQEPIQPKDYNYRAVHALISTYGVDEGIRICRSLNL